jgi:hypothetical protein
MEVVRLMKKSTNIKTEEVKIEKRSNPVLPATAPFEIERRPI